MCRAVRHYPPEIVKAMKKAGYKVKETGAGERIATAAEPPRNDREGGRHEAL